MEEDIDLGMHPYSLVVAIMNFLQAGQSFNIFYTIPAYQMNTCI